MEMTKEVIEVPFEGVAARKLHDLFERGYTVCGVAIQRPSLVTDADRGAITTHGMVMWWPPEQHKIDPVPAPKNLYQITGNVADVNTVLIERSELRRLHEENQTLREKNGLLKYALTEHETLQAENAELEAMLDAVGAGGVGQSIKPQIQADTSPAAWAIYSDDGTAIRLWSKDKATAQDAADKFGLPLVPLYTAPQPTRQPLTDEKLYALYCEAMKGYYVSSLHHWRNAEAHKFARAIEAAVANQPPPRQPLTVETFTKLAHRMATKYTHRSDPSFAWYAFLPHTLEQFVRAIEAAHGITGGQ